MKKIFVTILLMFFILTPTQVFASETRETNKSRLLTNSSTVVQGVDVINAQQTVITPIRNKGRHGFRGHHRYKGHHGFRGHYGFSDHYSFRGYSGYRGHYGLRSHQNYRGYHGLRGHYPLGGQYGFRGQH